ncbi:oligosaccharide flippase family protein [Acinetobacter calcoaceticus]|uniref:lipopolysaccharide biosynthesis protein n=1 Tax=Acinetobacter calcoaceticus TaxID=471 RepID=UPI00190045FE|nr:oligosaccharide flippase family protein [Acinetobacter calcoaceticus]MBJ9722868.1 oligosaccharide flippase family protein [Acinetobacter calcoaceticus]
MNKVTKNIIANYLGKLWGFASIFIFVRFYIDILGVESYAIINFYTVILGLLIFADAGLTATLTRELARDISIQEKSNLVYTFERIYIFICILVASIIVISSNFIANNFLHSATYTPSSVAYFIKLIGVGIAIQLFSTLYEGGLNGLQQQVLTNKIRIIWSLFRSGVVLIPIYFYPKLDIYFWWQVICNIVLLYVLRKSLYLFLPNKESIFSIDLVKSTGKYALGMMGIAFISAINIQIDKLVTSKYFSMKDFGYYSIASTLAQLPTMVVMPIIVAVFPLLSQFVSQQNNTEVTNNFHKYSFLTSSIAAPLAFSIALYSISIITLWTGRPEIALQINYVVKMLLVGGLFLCLQLTPFYLALANGFTRINLYSGIIGIIITIPLMIFSIQKYGMLGVTFPWIFINITTFFIVGMFIVNKFLPKQVYNWLLWDVCTPIIVTLFVIAIVEFSFKSIISNYLFIFKSIIIGFLSFTLNLFIYRFIILKNKLFFK